LTAYLDLADYLLIAEEVLGVPAETIAGWPGIGLAESALNAPAMGFAGVEFYPDVIDKAAVLCVRLARNHPLPDGNKRVATSPWWSFWLGTRSSGLRRLSRRRSR
jgi:death on curing protein